jgi:hypothetical protein
VTLVLLSLSSSAWATTTARKGIRSLDAAVREGVRVAIKLGRDGDVMVAKEVEVRKEADQDQELRALIDELDPGRHAFTLLGVEVLTDASTHFEREPGGSAGFEDLRVAMRVKVDGYRDPAGHFIAEKVRIRENQTYRERRIVGAIERIEPSSTGLAEVVVVGLRVRIDADTELVGGRGRARPIVRRRLGQIDDDDDLLFSSAGWFDNRLALAGEVRLRGELLSNIESVEDDEDLVVKRGNDEIVLEIDGLVGLAADLGPWFAYVEARGGKEYLFESERPFDEGQSDARIGEAYVELRGLGVPWLAIAVGRQKFNEEREWHYNRKNLDAVRLLADFGRTSVEASVSRDIFDQSRNLRDQDLVNTMIQVRYEVVDDIELEAYWLDRRDRTDLDDSPRILGLRLLAERGRHIEAWLDLARQTGSVCTRRAIIDLDGDGLADDLVDGGNLCPRDREIDPVVRDVRALAFDGGLTYRPRIRLDPTFTFGYASGSGERDAPLDQQLQTTATSFRQSGLHRNRWKFNGHVSFRYYGEVLDPTLMNLRIWTAGIGLRPARRFSIDAIYHRYRQDKPSRRFHDYDAGEQPSGIDPDIGEEWDLVLGYEPNRRFELRLTGGFFMPGEAFDSSVENSAAARFQAKFRF